MPQPTTNNLEGWEEFKIEELACRYANDYGEFQRENTVSLKCEIISKEIKQLITELRKHDMAELIKMFDEFVLMDWSGEDEVYEEIDRLKESLKQIYAK